MELIGFIETVSNHFQAEPSRNKMRIPVHLIVKSAGGLPIQAPSVGKSLKEL